MLSVKTTGLGFSGRAFVLCTTLLVFAGLSGGCTDTRMITKPNGEKIPLEQAPAEEAWILLDKAHQESGTQQEVLGAMGMSGWAELAAQFNKASQEANEAAGRADVPEQLFDELRDTVVAEAALTLPKIARDKNALQFLYVGTFVDESANKFPEMRIRLQSVASFLQRNSEFNDTVDILPSSFSTLSEVESEVQSELFSEDPTAGPRGINKEDVWVLTGTFAVSSRKQNRETVALINIELTNLGSRRTISRSSDATYYFHPGQALMRFISEEENQERWRNWK